jgi:hypothetical protein
VRVDGPAPDAEPHRCRRHLVDRPEWVDSNVNLGAADLDILPVVAVGRIRAYFAACAGTDGTREGATWTVARTLPTYRPLISIVTSTGPDASGSKAVPLTRTPKASRVTSPSLPCGLPTVQRGGGPRPEHGVRIWRVGRPWVSQRCRHKHDAREQGPDDVDRVGVSALLRYSDPDANTHRPWLAYSARRGFSPGTTGMFWLTQVNFTMAGLPCLGSQIPKQLYS